MAYKTEQRARLLEFFEAHPHDTFCAKDICSALADSGISVSAIYRNLASMEKEGLLRCHAERDSRDRYYQFVDRVHCGDAIHLTCVECGSTFHLDPSVAKRMQSALEQSEGFCISKTLTVLYGTCKSCAESEKVKK